MNILETERCYLRELSPEDAKHFYALNADPDVIKYTGDRSFKDLEAARDFLKAYDHYALYGFGRWAVIEKQSGDFLGWCGLKYTPELNEHDIGFRFFKKHWNKGYATETAKASINLGFEKLNIPVIVGRAMPGNIGSINVLTKLGLTFLEERRSEAKMEMIYRIINPNL